MVEDDPVNARLFQMILARRGHYEVSITEDPDEILHLVRSGQVALVVMDVSLKNATYAGEAIDGVGITRLIKADERTRNTPVLLATARAMPGDRDITCSADEDATVIRVAATVNLSAFLE